MKNITYASSKWSGEAAHLRSQIVYTSYVIKVFFAYSSSEWSGEPAHSHSLTRAFGITLKRRDVDEGLGQIVWAGSRKFCTDRICEKRIPKKEGMWMKAQAKILGSVHEKYHIC